MRLKQEALNEARLAPRKRPAAGPGSGGGSGGSAQGLSGDQWYSQSAMRAVNQVCLLQCMLWGAQCGFQHECLLCKVS